MGNAESADGVDFHSLSIDDKETSDYFVQHKCIFFFIKWHFFHRVYLFTPCTPYLQL